MSRNNEKVQKTTHNTTGFYRLPKVLEIIPVSKSHFYAGVKSGKYPAGVRISENVVAWKISDINALVEKLSNGTEAH